MCHKHKKKIFRIDKIVDWWSVPHFMFGMVTALCAITFSFSPVDFFLMTLLLALGWELLEKKYRLSEAPGNAWADVFLAGLSFVFTYFLVDTSPLKYDGHFALLTITCMLYGMINLIAWRARFERDRQFMG